MNYSLNGHKKPNIDENLITFPVYYSTSEGLQPKSCASLEINLKHDSAHSTADLINILGALPKSIESLVLPWHDNIISNTDFIEVLHAVPEWVTSLSFSQDDNCKVLSVRDLEIMQAIPKSCKSFWHEAFNIPQANNLILLLQSLPSSIIKIILFQDKLKRYSQQELSLISSAMPTSVKQLRIANHHTFNENISANEMIRILKHIPVSIVDLTCDYFHGYMSDTDEGYVNIKPSINDAEMVLMAIPPSVTDFTLSLPTEIASNTVVESHKRLLRAIPRTVVNLSVNGFLDSKEEKEQSTFNSLLNNLTSLIQRLFLTTKIKENISALQTLPASVKKLYLRNAKRFSASCLIEMMRAIPPNISELTLDFGRGNHHLITLKELASAIRLLPTSIKKFTMYDFWHRRDISADDLMTIYAAIPPTIEDWDIGYGCKFSILSYTPEDRIKLLQALPRSFGKKLKLCLNDTRNISEANLVNILQVIPTFISSLCLNEMKICESLDTSSVSRIFKAMPESINFLGFRRNDLFRLGVDGIISALQSISSGITHLDLRDNYFQPKDVGDYWIGASFTPDDLLRILQAIPAHVTHIYMDYEYIQIMKAFTVEAGIFNSLNLYYDFTKECFVKMELNRNRLSHITLGTLPSDIVSDKIAQYLSFRELTRVVQATVIKDPVVSNKAINRLKA